MSINSSHLTTNAVTASRLFPLVLSSLLALSALISVQFSDFVPSIFGSYEDQRFLLGVVSGLLVFFPIVTFALNPPVVTYTLVSAGLPTFLLCFSFIALTLPFYSLPYVWVEPGMYVLFFLAPLLSGMHLAWSGNAIRFASTLLLMIAGTCLVYGLGSLTVYTFATADGVSDLIGFIPWGFANIRYWSHIATWCLPLMPLAVLLGPLRYYRSWRFAVLLGAGMWWWILFMTTARGSALGIVFGVAVGVGFFGRRSLPWLRQLAAQIIAGGVIWLLLSVAIPSLIDDTVSLRTVKVDSSGRMPLFSEAWQMSLQNFPFGMGPQSWLTHDILTETYAGSAKFAHPHNMYLMWAAEYGWFLVATLGLVAVQAIRYFGSTRRLALAEVQSGSSADRLLLLMGFTSSVSAALFHAGVSAVIMAPGSMLVGLFVLSAFWGLIMPRQLVPATSRANQSSMVRAGIAVVLGGVIFTAWLSWIHRVSDYYDDMREDAEANYETVGEGMLPRFWFHGNFPRR